MADPPFQGDDSATRAEGAVNETVRLLLVASARIAHFRTELAVQRFGMILAAKDCATIFPFRTTNVSVAAS
jgi:hypothetical protein